MYQLLNEEKEGEIPDELKQKILETDRHHEKSQKDNLF